MNKPLKLRDLNSVIRLDEPVVIYDRFHRFVDNCPFGELSDHLMKYEVRDLTFSPMYQCVSIKLAYGKFQLD